MATIESPIIELYGEEVRHCRAPYSPIQVSAFTELETLPYGKLGGRGFERLCYEILLAQGYQPRFFGRSGQQQPEIDLVAIKDEKTEVFSCKNLGGQITFNKLQERLAAFEEKWLKQAGLPKPQRFVICWPKPFRDAKIEKDWNNERENFRQRTGGIQADIWHLDLLNGWLKKLPDIVADLFSDRHTENFCDPDIRWNYDLFIPLREGASGDPRLKHYFDYRRGGKLYLFPDYEQGISEALENFNVILLRGLPGTGKTFTALAVAEGFRNGRCRTYFLDVGRDEFNPTQLKEGLRRRLSRPSLFLLENSHLKPEAIEQALRDLEPELKESGRAKIICLARRVSGSDVSRSDDLDYFQELETLGACVDFDNTDKRLRQIIEFWRPDFAGISGKRLAKLAAIGGKDLLLLNEALSVIDSPAEIDTFTPAALYDKVRHRYFGCKTVDELPNIRRLAALAQFDLRPRADVLRLPDAEWQLIHSLCVKADTPPRWYFLHSTAAELVLHALWAGMGETDPATIAEYAAEDVIDYFRDLQSNRLRAKPTPMALETDLLAIVGNRLKLAGDDGENHLKASVMDSEPMHALFQKVGALPRYPRTAWLCTLVAHRVRAASTQSFYARHLQAMLKNAMNTADQKALVALLPVFGSCFRVLQLAAPNLHGELVQGLSAQHLLAVLVSDGTIPDLFGIVQHTHPELARGLIDTLDEVRVAKLIQKTIATGRSIGTLNFTLRELRSSEETAALGEALERKIGPLRFLDLIEANGTIPDLFRIVQYASPELARGLIDALDEARVAKLIQRTITAGRSIGTLDFTLRDLRSSEETAALGEELERKISPVRFLDLIEANGTVFELFMIVKSASRELARGLIDALDEARVAKLIQKTIDSGRSTGTLNLTLRELHSSEETTDLADGLERKIGVAGFWKLLVGGGSPGPLVDLARDMSPAFRSRFIAAAHDLSPVDWAALLGRGELFQLAELIADRPEIFAEEAGGSRLLAAIETEAAQLATQSNWYARNTCSKRFAECIESPIRGTVVRALDEWLARVEVEQLAFPSLHEAVNGLELLCERRPVSLPLLAGRLWTLLPPSRRWKLDPKKDMALPRLLLRLVSHPEFSDADAGRVKAEVAGCLTPKLITNCRTVDILWTAWAFFTFDTNRAAAPRALGQHFPANLQTAVIESLEARAPKTAKFEELRARFALLGLLGLMGVAPTRERAAGLYAPHPSLWALISDQPFVMAYLVVQGISVIEPRKPVFTPALCRDLLARASQYEQIDHATESLRQDVLRKQRKLAAFNSNQYSRRRP